MWLSDYVINICDIFFKEAAERWPFFFAYLLQRDATLLKHIVANSIEEEMWP